MFEDPARAYFFASTKDQMNYDQLKSIMVMECDIYARQSSAQTKLENITLKGQMTEQGIEDYAEGLTSLVSKIEKTTPQGPPEFRSDRNKGRSSERLS